MKNTGITASNFVIVFAILSYAERRIEKLQGK